MYCRHRRRSATASLDFQSWSRHSRACDSDGETRPRTRNALWTFIWPSTDRIELSVLQNISQNAANVDRHDYMYTGWPLRLELKLSSLYFIYPEVQIKRTCIQCDSQQSGRVHFRSALATAPYKEKGKKASENKIKKILFSVSFLFFSLFVCGHIFFYLNGE